MRRPKTVCSVSCQHLYQRTDIVKQKSREKSKKTLLLRYGVDHNSKLGGFLDKRKNSNLQKYGVEHYTNRDKAKQTKLDRHGDENYNNKSKIKETMLSKYGVSAFSQSPLFKTKLIEKYGVEHPLHTPKNKQRMYSKVISRLTNIIPLFNENDYDGVHAKMYPFKCNTCKTQFEAALDDGKIPICRSCNPLTKTKSKCEYEIIDWLNSIYNGTIIHGDKTVLLGKELDIYLPDKKLAIEINGLYYHSEISGKKNKHYHLNKTKHCNRLGITLIHVLDIEWSNKQDIVKSIIYNKVTGGGVRHIHGRICTIQELTPAVCNEFLNRNHIQREDTSSVRIGLFYGEELVSVLTFGKNRFNKETDWEMYRYCIVLGANVRGGLEKMFKYFVKKYEPNGILSFADRRYFTGESYGRVGFKLVSITPPNYHYFKVNNHTTIFSSRNRFQKHKLSKLLENVDPNLTEWQNMQLNGYDRIWDCGNTKWVWYKQ